MTRFDTPIPLSLALLWWGLACAALVWALARLRVVRRRYRLSLFGLRLGALTVLLLMLLNPYREIETPDPEGFRVLLLADASQSMATADVRGESRFSVVRKQLANEGDTLAKRLGSAYRLSAQVFSEDMRPARLDATKGVSEQGLLPGKTAIGDVLNAALEENAGVPLGAVILLSDGHTNAGRPLPEVCKQYRSRDIPVTCVGIGRVQPISDVRVQAPPQAMRGVKGKPLTIPVHVRSLFPSEIPVTIELDDGSGKPLVQTIELAPGQEPTTVRFTYTPWRSGFQTCRLRVLPVAGDGRPDNDIDFVAMEVREPDTFSVLYLSSHLDWEYKFLGLLAKDNKQLSLAATVQTGHNAFFRTGFPEDIKDKVEGFAAERDVLNRFDAVLLDLRVIPSLNEKQIAAILEFVEHRGGGLLCTGSLKDLPQTVLDALPVLPAEAITPSPTDRIVPNPEFVFDRDPSGVLRISGGLPVPDGAPAWFVAKLKKGGRNGVELFGHTDLAALAAQRYGSGRIAYLGLQNTWRWRLADDQGERRFDAFWNALLVWLGSTRKPRINSACAGQKAGLGDPVALDVDVLGDDFLPAPDARVAASLVAPDGSRRDVELEPAPGTPGRYSAMAFPEQSGEYRVDYRVVLPQRHFEKSVHFVARQTGVEAEDTTYREDILRDVARLTGGQFLPASDLDSLRDVTLGHKVPVHRERVHWTRSWWWLGLLVVLLGLDWFARRRIGLK